MILDIQSKLKKNPPTRFKQLTEFPVQNQLPESSLAGFVIPGTLKLNIHLALLNSETKQVQVKNGNIFFFYAKVANVQVVDLNHSCSMEPIFLRWTSLPVIELDQLFLYSGGYDLS